MQAYNKNRLSMIFKVLGISLLCWELFSCDNAMQNLFKHAMSQVEAAVGGIQGTDGQVNASVISMGSLQAKQIPNSLSVRLTWTPNAHADSFVVYRTTAKPIEGSRSEVVGYEFDPDAAFSEVARVNNNGKKAASFSDLSVTTGVGYAYTVKALRQLNGVRYESPLSPVSIVALQYVPQDVRASFKASSDFIRISWSPIIGVSRYSLYRADRPYSEVQDPEDPDKKIKVAPEEPPTADYTLLQELVTPYFTDLSVEQETVKDRVFFYRVTALINGKPSLLKDSGCGIGEYLPPGAIPPPVKVTASQGFKSAITVTWPARGGVSEYVIYRSEDRTVAEAALLNTLKPCGRSATARYVDTKGIDASHHYFYAVSCINDKGDEGNYSSDCPNDGTPFLLNEGFLLTAPAIRAQYFHKQQSGSEPTALFFLNWDPVPGADGYLVSTDGGQTFPTQASEIISEPWLVVENGSVDAAYTAAAVKRKPDSPVDFEVSDPSPIPPNREFVMVGSTCLSDGSVRFDWDPNVAALFDETASVLRRPLFQTAFEPLPGEVHTNEPFTDDQPTPDFDYVTLGAKIFGLQPEAGQSHNECLKHFFSDSYQFILTRNGEPYSVKGEGIRLFSPEEFYYIVKIADHTATNKTVNKITEVFTKRGKSLAGNAYPESKETDQGYFSGSLLFDPYKPPSIDKQWAEIAFRFNKMEDYPGLIIDGVNYVWKNSDSGKLNNPDSKMVEAQNPTLHVILFDEIRIDVEERADIDRNTSAVLGGTSTITVKQRINNTQQELMKHTFAEPALKAFFDDKDDRGPIATKKLITNCPGGRNFTRNDASGEHKSTGHYGVPGEDPWLDPVNCGIRARLKERDKSDKIADPDGGFF